METEEAMFEIDRNTVRGGKTVYGAAVGILVLDTKSPRMPGDIGYAPLDAVQAVRICLS